MQNTHFILELSFLGSHLCIFGGEIFNLLSVTKLNYSSPIELFLFYSYKIDDHENISGKVLSLPFICLNITL